MIHEHHVWVDKESSPFDLDASTHPLKEGQ